MILNGWYPLMDKQGNMFIRKHSSNLLTITVARIDPNMKFFTSDEGVVWELGSVHRQIATVEIMEKLFAISQPR